MSIVPGLGSCTLAVVIPLGIAWFLLSRCQQREVRNGGLRFAKALYPARSHDRDTLLP